MDKIKYFAFGLLQFLSVTSVALAQPEYHWEIFAIGLDRNSASNFHGPDTLYHVSIMNPNTGFLRNFTMPYGELTPIARQLRVKVPEDLLGLTFISQSADPFVAMHKLRIRAVAAELWPEFLDRLAQAFSSMEIPYFYDLEKAVVERSVRELLATENGLEELSQRVFEASKGTVKLLASNAGDSEFKSNSNVVHLKLSNGDVTRRIMLGDPADPIICSSCRSNACDEMLVQELRRSKQKLLPASFDTMPDGS